MYSFMMALYSSLYFFWLRLMKKAPDRRSRMWMTAMLRKSSAAAMWGHLMPLPKKTQLMMRKSMQLRWVGMMISGPWVYSLWDCSLVSPALSITTFSQMAPKTLWRNQANIRKEPMEQSLNICVHISSAAFFNSSSAFSQEIDGPYSFIIFSSTSILIASFTALLFITNSVASWLDCPLALLPSRSAHMMSEKQGWLSGLSRLRVCGLNCSTSSLRRCFLMLQTQRRTQVLQLMELMLNQKNCCYQGLIWLKMSIDLMLQQCHYWVRKYLYFFRMLSFCWIQWFDRLPSIFQDIMSKKVPIRFFAYEGSSSLVWRIFLPSALWVTLTLGVLLPYSLQADWQYSKNCCRVIQFLVLVDRLTVSALRLVVLADRTIIRLATQSVGTISTLFFLKPSMFLISPVPSWQIRQVKQLKLMAYPQKLDRVGPREGTLRMIILLATFAQLLSTKPMLHLHPSTSLPKLSPMQATASSFRAKVSLDCVSSSSSSSDKYPGSLRQMLDRCTILLIQIL